MNSTISRDAIDDSLYVITDVFLDKKYKFIEDANKARKELLIKLTNKYQKDFNNPSGKNYFFSRARHRTKIQFAYELCLRGSLPFNDFHHIQKFFSYLETIKKKNESFHVRNSEFTHILNDFPEDIKNEIAYFQEKINQISQEMLLLLYYVMTIIREEKSYKNFSKINYSDSFVSDVFFDVIYNQPHYIKKYCREADEVCEKVASSNMDKIESKLEDYLKFFDDDDKLKEIECHTLPYYLNLFDYMLFCDEKAHNAYEKLEDDKKQITFLTYILLTHFSNQLMLQEKLLLLHTYCNNDADSEKKKCYKYNEQQDWYKNSFLEGYTLSKRKSVELTDFINLAQSGNTLNQIFKNFKKTQFPKRKERLSKLESCENEPICFKTHTFIRNLNDIPLELIDTLTKHKSDDVFLFIRQAVTDKLNGHLKLLDNMYLKKHYQISFLEDWVQKLKHLSHELIINIESALDTLISKRNNSDLFINEIIKCAQTFCSDDKKTSIAHHEENKEYLQQPITTERKI